MFRKGIEAGMREEEGGTAMAELGEVAQIHYRGRLDDGREFESSIRAGEPLEVRLGSGRLLPAVERVICEMNPRDRRTVRLEPDQAFGAYDEALVITVPADRLPNASALPVGEFVEVRTDAGALRAKVVSADGQAVVLDCNHELAGQAVTFDIELLAVIHESAISRELHPAGCACGCDKLKEQIG